MKPEEFDFIASLLKEYSGFSLVPSQLYLLESRLGPLLRQNNLIGLEDLVTSLKLNNTELRKSMIEAVSVNNTRFFRNKYVFENIKNFILQKAKKFRTPGCGIFCFQGRHKHRPIVTAYGLA